MTVPDNHPTVSSTVPFQIERSLPRGARYFRCALQVNPFEYVKRHGQTTTYQSENEYNSAIVDKCLELEIEVIAVTDHYRVKDSISLVRTARNKGLYAFMGFEAVTKEGVHVLCLFDHDDVQKIERIIGQCGIRDTEESSPSSDLDFTALLDIAKEWKAVTIAAHVAAEGGLLRTLKGKPRIRAWTHKNLVACALPGPVKDAPGDLAAILNNQDVQHKRDRMPAILNASDVNDPADLEKNRSSCYIKMSSVSIEAFRQAFLDPDSRIRLHSDASQVPHTEFVAMSWEGGFLHDTKLHFNENLNVLIGGRGTGKSTVIESIRYVLDLQPLGKNAGNAHDGIVNDVLRPGTKVSLLVRTHAPSENLYTIERTVPNPPIVKNEAGEVLSLLPRDIVPGVDLFGQHEISELTNSPEKLTLLLEKYVHRNSSLSDGKSGAQLALKHSQRQVLDALNEKLRLEEKLSSLPSLEENQKRYQKAGIDKVLKERTQLVREERLFVDLEERLGEYRALQSNLSEGLPIDTAFFSDRSLEDLPNADLLSNIHRILENLNDNLNAINKVFSEAISEADSEIAETKSLWDGRRSSIDETYEVHLRELQKSNINGDEFIENREKIEALRPLDEAHTSLTQNLNTLNTERLDLLEKWDEAKLSYFETIKEVANRISEKLHNKVRIKVSYAGNLKPLEELLQKKVGGNLHATMERLQRDENLALKELAKCIEQGAESLKTRYKLTSSSAKRIAEKGFELAMDIEQLDLPASTEIELNTAPAGDPVKWRSLKELSTGQKATAVLLLLLLESEAPLVIDQPEDDLDNRFISEDVVPSMREEKRRRQFIFSTHNANIPVLGDAELILGLTASGSADVGQAEIKQAHMASIDSRPVREFVEEILEGGEAAFELRRSKYGF